MLKACVAINLITNDCCNIAMSKCNKSWIAELIISRSQYYAWGIRYCPLALAAKSPKHQQMVSNTSWGKTLARQIARFQKYLVTWFTFSEVSHKYLQLRVMSKYHMCYFSPIMFKAKLSSPMIIASSRKIQQYSRVSNKSTGNLKEIWPKIPAKRILTCSTIEGNSRF